MGTRDLEAPEFRVPKLPDPRESVLGEIRRGKTFGALLTPEYLHISWAKSARTAHWVVPLAKLRDLRRENGVSGPRVVSSSTGFVIAAGLLTQQILLDQQRPGSQPVFETDPFIWVLAGMALLSLIVLGFALKWPFLSFEFEDRHERLDMFLVSRKRLKAFIDLTREQINRVADRPTLTPGSATRTRPAHRGT